MRLLPPRREGPRYSFPPPPGSRLWRPSSPAWVGERVRALAAPLIARARAAGVPGAHTPVAGTEPLPPATVAAERLRVLTLNVRGGLGPSGRRASRERLDALAATITAHRPDVALLQEVDDFALRSGFHDQLAELGGATAAAASAWAGVPRGVTGRGQGVMLMSFGPAIDAVRNLILPDPNGDGFARRAVRHVGAAAEYLAAHGRIPRLPIDPARPRNALEAVIVTAAGNAVRVLCVHLSWGPMHPRQVEALASAVGAAAGPAVVAGDFNTGSATAEGREEAERVAAIGLADAFSAAGLGPGDPARRTFGTPARRDLDRIYYASRHFSVEAARVSEGDRSSDHRPVIADLALGPREQAE
ncbi:MAG: endonuclease/exonuclease/phosphatase family protein [Actinomycetota bacterium]